MQRSSCLQVDVSTEVGFEYGYCPMKKKCFLDVANEMIAALSLRKICETWRIVGKLRSELFAEGEVDSMLIQPLCCLICSLESQWRRPLLVSHGLSHEGLTLFRDVSSRNKASTCSATSEEVRVIGRFAKRPR